MKKINRTKNPIAVELGTKGGVATFLRHGRAHYFRMSELALAKKKKERTVEVKLVD